MLELILNAAIYNCGVVSFHAEKRRERKSYPSIYTSLCLALLAQKVKIFHVSSNGRFRSGSTNLPALTSSPAAALEPLFGGGVHCRGDPAGSKVAGFVSLDAAIFCCN